MVSKPEGLSYYIAENIGSNLLLTIFILNSTFFILLSSGNLIHERSCNTFEHLKIFSLHNCIMKLMGRNNDLCR